MQSVIPWITPITQIIVAMVFVGSFIVGYFTLRSLRQTNELSVLKNIMEEYNKLLSGDSLTNYHSELHTWKDDMLSSRLTPHTFYYFKLKHISTIGQFYDYTGLLIRQKLVDFNMLFEILPFPHVFWHESRDFRKNMQELTYAEFWNNFEYMYQLYSEERSHRDKPAHRRNVLRS